ncbi:hypothetical protein H5410_011780 [Solanum commersonii]|uniref:Uncharacterized protein n=1 Tax=Solanum commersonii TaxID=4109 RepID=A0A9J6AQV4_SOLCO|nr:hypothetical protein H5410_011780 [Solanum commersonii]
MNLEKRVESWNKCIPRNLGIPWGFLIRANYSTKPNFFEDGMFNVFSPGELIGLLRAERMGRALKETCTIN